jgi:hypothetical protein
LAFLGTIRPRQQDGDFVGSLPVPKDGGKFRVHVHNAAWPDEPAVFAYDGLRMSTVGAAWKKACEKSRALGFDVS